MSHHRAPPPPAFEAAFENLLDAIHEHRGPIYALTFALNAETIQAGFGAVNSPLRQAFLNFIAAYDQALADEAYRQSMLKD